MGSRIISKNARSLNGFEIADTIPTDGQILAYQQSSSKYIPSDSSGGGGDNISSADLTQTDLDRTYTMPNLGKLAFGGVNSEFHLEDAIDFRMFNGSNDTASNERFGVFVGANTSYLFFNNNRTSITTVSDDLTLQGFRTNSGLKTEIVLGADLYLKAQSTRFVVVKANKMRWSNSADNIGYGQILNGVFVWGGGSGSTATAIGNEGFSVQKDMLVKGSDNSEVTSGFKVTDVNNDVTFDVKNNGQIGYGGAKDNLYAHKFRNPNNEGHIASFDDDTTGTQSFVIDKSGSFHSEMSGEYVFLSYRQAGQSWIKLYDAGVNYISINKAHSFFNGSVCVGNVTGTSNTRFSIEQASSVVSQQGFFGNARVTTAGRLGSDTGFDATQKGLECYDTTLNKKFFWNGTAWEKIKGNIESVSVASASTITPNVDSSEMEIVSALAAALTIAAPTGTVHEGKELTFRIKDNGTARALTWNAIFVDYTGALPTTTVAGKTVYIGCKYNAVDTKWDVVAVQAQP